MIQAEEQLQLSLLNRPIGSPGSGAARYAAAMYFYANGVISAELLELFRRCLNLDGEDPFKLAKDANVFVPPQLVLPRKP